MNETEQRKNNFEILVNDYVAEFIAKHGLKFDCWIDKIGSFASFENNYVVSFDTIKYIIDNDIGGQVFFDWYEHCQVNSTKYNINFENFVKGARNENL